jgi:hypothetical protein
MTPQRHNPLLMRLPGRFEDATKVACGVFEKASRAFIDARRGVCGVFF